MGEISSGVGTGKGRDGHRIADMVPRMSAECDYSPFNYCQNDSIRASMPATVSLFTASN
jgi:hypothetical protein